MPLGHPHGAVPEWPYIFHDTLNDGPFILCCDERLVITIFWNLEPLTGELPYLVGSLK